VDKWFVKVTDTQLATLRDDLRELGTLRASEEGEHYLVFRDSFVALKVASYLGLQRQHGRSVSGRYVLEHSQVDKYHPLLTLENGDVLVADFV
jgi:hypothetical protein